MLTDICFPYTVAIQCNAIARNERHENKTVVKCSRLIHISHNGRILITLIFGIRDDTMKQTKKQKNARDQQLSNQNDKRIHDAIHAPHQFH